MKISNNFNYEECFKEDHKDTQVVLNMAHLVNNILQPIRDKYGVVTVTSAYRSRKYNAEVGGVPDSQHCEGNAVDIVVLKANLFEVFKYIVEFLPYDKIIYSIDTDRSVEWIHVSSRINKGANRRIPLIEKIISGKKVFSRYEY